jgi:hypothetical protein
MHELDDIQHLHHEVSTALFTHGAKGLADIKQETTGDKLELDVDEIFNFSS